MTPHQLTCTNRYYTTDTSPAEIGIVGGRQVAMVVGDEFCRIGGAWEWTDVAGRTMSELPADTDNCTTATVGGVE